MDVFVEVSKALSIVAIPVVLAVGGWIIQREVEHQSLRKEYVALALSILREPDTSEPALELRSWAVDLLNANSEVQFSEATTKHLKTGETSLPSDFAGRDLTRFVEQRLKAFQRYLISVGFDVAPGRVQYEIKQGDSVDGANTALYEPERHAMVIASKYADEPDIARHEFMRRVLERHDPDLNWVVMSLDSALAVYFSCAVDGHSVFAATTDLRIDLGAGRSLDVPLPGDGQSSYQVGSYNWASALWALRQVLTPEAADRLIARTWVTWKRPISDDEIYASFALALVQGARSNGALIEQVLRDRGLELSSAPTGKAVPRQSKPR